MGRRGLWVVVVAALAVVGWLLFGVWGEDDAGGGNTPSETQAGSEQSPELTGARSAGSDEEPSGTEAFTIRGVVRDEQGQPVPGVAVEARREGRGVNPHNPATWGRTPAQAVEDLITRAARKASDQRPLGGRAQADAEGRFTLRVSRAGRYYVRALPAAPRFGVTGYVALHPGNPEAQTSLTTLGGAALEGRVLDADGRPVSCTVVGSYDGSAMGGLVGGYRGWTSAPVVTDPEDGSWRFEAVPLGAVQLEVRLEGGRRVTGYHALVPHDGPYEIRLAGGSARLEGRVTDPEGVPVPDALVLLELATEVTGTVTTLSLRGDTEDDGTFSFDDLPAGELRKVEVAAAGYLPYPSPPVNERAVAIAVGPGKPTSLPVTLSRGGAILGRVVELAGGKPIVGAVVELAPRGIRDLRQHHTPSPVTTDAEGRYRIEGVPLGAYVALPKAEGYYLPQVAAQGRVEGRALRGEGQEPTGLAVVVREDGRPVTRDLALAKGFQVEGMVVDTEGEPVSGAAVFAKDYGRSYIPRSWGIRGQGREPLTFSGGDGRFTVRGLPPYSGWVLFARKDGYAGAYAEPFALSADTQPPSLRLALAKGAVLRGRVEGLAPAEAGEVRLRVRGLSAELVGMPYGYRADADGRFELLGVPPGDWTISADVGGREGRWLDIKDLAVGEVREDLRVVFGRGFVLLGCVVDRDGAPVAALSLRLLRRHGWNRRTAVTDADGRFSFAGVPEGSVRIEAEAPQGASVALGEPFEVPSAGVTLVYDEPETVVLRGQVQAGDGTAIAVCTVRVEPVESTGPRGRPSPAPSGASQEAINGDFEVLAGGSGPWVVTATSARAEDGRRLNLAPAKVTVDDPSAPIVLTMDVGGLVGGRVLDAEGAPLEGIRVMVAQRATMTGPDGRFLVRGLEQGTVTVLVQPDGNGVRPPTQDVATGTEDLEFQVFEGLAVRGQAFDPKGAPLLQGVAYARWEATGRHPAGAARAEIRGDGRFELRGVPNGVRARLHVEPWGANTRAYPPAIVEGVLAGTEDVEVRLGEGAVIEGRMVDPDGKAPDTCFVAARATDGSAQSGYVETDAEGAFRITGLEPREYYLLAVRKNGGLRPPPVTTRAPAKGVEIRLPRAFIIKGHIAGLGDVGSDGWWVTVTDVRRGVVSVNPVALDGTFEAHAHADTEGVHLGVSKQGDSRYGRVGPLKAGAEKVVLKLQEGKRIAGIVESLTPDNPAVRRVRAEGADGWTAHGVISADGTFEILGLPDGLYVVKANRVGDGASFAQQAGIEAGSTGVRLKLK